MCVLFGIVCLFVFKTQRDIRAPKIYSHFAFRQKYSLYEHPPRFLCIFIIRPERVSVFGRDMAGVCVDVCAGGGGAEREVCWVYRVFSSARLFQSGGVVHLYITVIGALPLTPASGIYPPHPTPYPPVKQSTLSLSSEKWSILNTPLFTT